MIRNFVLHDVKQFDLASSCELHGSTSTHAS